VNIEHPQPPSDGPPASDPDAIRADVKGQATAKVAYVKDQATTDSGKPRPEIVAGAFVVALLVAGLIWWRRG
jgi:hypothetical protein